MIDNLATGVGGFTSNTFLVQGDRTVLIDTGNGFDLVDAVSSHTDELDTVVLTHTHPDHIGNLASITDAFDVDVWGFDSSVSGVDRELADEATITIGDHEYTVLHTPGHKDDHVCLYGADPGILFAGDLVFENGGFGRTDLEEGDRNLLIESINRVLDAVSEDLGQLHVGHGPSVTTDPYETITLAYRAARM
ncbi:MBL fold metallo-hydrolase [Halorhabdus salina]|uniref:MBL fold metallo-hydrolase n=1 Tax=Halorhabdus salina TaxID=2750670 RepID=UPI0015EE3DCA|nr:MBL fold metallo-hydrolase [Halorhabdus salina]